LRKQKKPLFAAIPAQLNSNVSRYKISSVIAGAKAEDFTFTAT